MFLIEEKIMNKVVDSLFENLNIFETKKLGFEKMEIALKQTIMEIGRRLLQKIIDQITLQYGFSEKMKLPLNKKTYVFAKKYKSSLQILSLFGNIKLPFARYENKSTHKAIRINHVDYKEKDSTSPNVKKMIVHLTPFDFYESANKTLFAVGNINISLSNLKNISNNIAQNNAEWFWEQVQLKNELSKEESLLNQAERIVISHDGGRIQTIQSDFYQGRITPKNPEWKEFKVGTVFPIDSNGRKNGESFCYGTIDNSWKKLEPVMNYSVNRYGIIKCTQFETISDCGNGIKEMYTRNFGAPDNKRYFDCADFYHSTEYLWDIAKNIYPNLENTEKSSPEAVKWTSIGEEILKKKGGNELLNFIQTTANHNTILKSNYDEYIKYFKNNNDRMNYHIALQNNLPIGSGNIEASIKKLVNKRFKRSNIYWKLDNAENLFCLQCCVLNNDLNDYWKWRDDKLNHWNVIYDMKQNNKVYLN